MLLAENNSEFVDTSGGSRGPPAGVLPPRISIPLDGERDLSAGKKGAGAGDASRSHVLGGRRTSERGGRHAPIADVGVAEDLPESSVSQGEQAGRKSWVSRSDDHGESGGDGENFIHCKESAPASAEVAAEAGGNAVREGAALEEDNENRTSSIRTVVADVEEEKSPLYYTPPQVNRAS